MTKLITLHFVTTTYLHFIKSVNELYCKQNTKRHHVVIEIALCHNGRAVVWFVRFALGRPGFNSLAESHRKSFKNDIHGLHAGQHERNSVEKSQQVPLG